MTKKQNIHFMFVVPARIVQPTVHFHYTPSFCVLSCFTHDVYMRHNAYRDENGYIPDIKAYRYTTFLLSKQQKVLSGQQEGFINQQRI